jgi:hypothetical protein
MDNNDFDLDQIITRFNMLINCRPLHNYVIDFISNVITFYCARNNTIIIPIENIMDY